MAKMKRFWFFASIFSAAIFLAAADLFAQSFTVCLETSLEARKQKDYDKAIIFGEKALALSKTSDNTFKAAEAAFRGYLEGPRKDEAWEWLEKLISRGEHQEQLLRNLIGLYGFYAHRMFLPERTRFALSLCEKYGVEPGYYHDRWLRTIETFDQFKTFPRAENEIKFPEAPNYFCRGLSGKTVDVANAADLSAPDMSAAIQSLIDSPDVSTIRFGKTEKPYRISKLIPRSNQTFIFEEGVVILADEETQLRRNEKERLDMNLFHVSGVSNVVFVGTGKSPESVQIGKYSTTEERLAHNKSYGGSGFHVENSKNIAIYNLAIKNCTMDGLAVGGLKFPSAEIFLKDVIIESNHRQGISLCNVHGIYLKNVTISKTLGGSPMCGIDIEPSIQEVQAISEIYLFDCNFQDNARSHLNFSCSSAYPISFCAKGCTFEPNPYGNVEIFALPGIYFAADVEAPSKIIFDRCTFKQFADKAAIRFKNASFFNVDFIDSLVEALPGAEGGGEKCSSALSFELERDYGKPIACDKPGKVRFENFKINGFENSPVISFFDTTGTYAVGNISGTAIHNGNAVDMKNYQHPLLEEKLEDVNEIKSAAFAPFNEMRAREIAAKSRRKRNKNPALEPVPAEISFQQIAPWFNRKPNYTAIYWDGLFWETREVAPNALNLTELAGFPIAYCCTNCAAIQLGTKPSAVEKTIYFEVPAGSGECCVRIFGDAELFDPAGKKVGGFSTDDGDARVGAKYLRFTPTSPNSEIWSIRIAKNITLKFFKPLTGVFAEKPEWVPCLKK